jgi:hypothetical protein
LFRPPAGAEANEVPRGRPGDRRRIGDVDAHLHFHTLVLDGVFVREAAGTLRFHPASPPTDDDVHCVVARVRRRLERLGVTGAASADENADPLADESAALAGLSRAAILGRAALGPRAGRRPMRIGADPDAPWVPCPSPTPAERLCQYLCRPPLGQSRLHRLRDGRVAVALQRPWADGTTHLVFMPLELLERLVPLVPRPRINLVLCDRVALGVIRPARAGGMGRGSDFGCSVNFPGLSATTRNSAAPSMRSKPRWIAGAPTPNSPHET